MKECIDMQTIQGIPNDTMNNYSAAETGAGAGAGAGAF